MSAQHALTTRQSPPPVRARVQTMPRRAVREELAEITRGAPTARMRRELLALVFDYTEPWFQIGQVVADDTGTQAVDSFAVPLEIDGPITLMKLETARVDTARLLSELRNVLFVAFESRENDGEAAEFAKHVERINRVSVMLEGAVKVIGGALEMQKAAHMRYSMDDVSALSGMSFQPLVIDEKDLKGDALIVYSHMLRRMSMNKYRRKDGACYAEVKTEEGYSTRAWARVCSIKELIYAECDISRYYNVHIAAARNPAVVATVESNLQYFNLPCFPDLKEDRCVISFRNGIYFMRDNVFLRYTDLEALAVYGDVASSHFIDQDWAPRFSGAPMPVGTLCPWCNVMVTESEGDASGGDENLAPDRARQGHPRRCPMSIKTPALDRLMNTQLAGKLEVQAWLCCMLGRLLRNLNETDRWQVAPFILGVGQSGKSTLLDVLRMMLPPGAIRLMSANMEEKFGVSGIVGGYMWACNETMQDWTISQADFNMIVEGTDVQVNYKHRTAEIVHWTTPGLLLGNRTPKFKNIQPAARRLLVFIFPVCVQSRGSFIDELRAELPAIIYKFNSMYLMFARRFGHASLWSIVPNYFRETRQQIVAEVSRSFDFINTALVCGPQLWIQKATFVAEHNRHVGKRYKDDPGISEIELQMLCTEQGLRIDKTSRPEGPGKPPGPIREYIIGACRIADAEWQRAYLLEQAASASMRDM